MIGTDFFNLISSYVALTTAHSSIKLPVENKLVCTFQVHHADFVNKAQAINNCVCMATLLIYNTNLYTLHVAEHIFVFTLFPDKGVEASPTSAGILSKRSYLNTTCLIIYNVLTLHQ